MHQQLPLTAPQAAASLLKPRAPAELRVLDAAGVPLAVGDRVEARYRGKGTRYYPARIVRFRVDDAPAAADAIGRDPVDAALALLLGPGAAAGAVIDLAYDDGDAENGASPRDMRRLGTVVDAPAGAVTDSVGTPLAVGDRVEARYRGKGTRYFAGRISRVEVDAAGVAKYTIAYDDGDRETGALAENVRRA